MAAKFKSRLSLKLLLIVAMVIPVSAMLTRAVEGLTAQTLLPKSEVPLWALGVHGGASVLFLALGALQILPGFRRHHRILHQQMGRAVFAIALIGAVSGIWITLAWPTISGPVLYWGRLAAGLFWLIALALAAVSIRRRDFVTHGRWMRRAYGLALTAGTLPFLLIPFIAIFGEGHPVLEEWLQIFGWAVNIWLIERMAGGNARYAPAVA